MNVYSALCWSRTVRTLLVNQSVNKSLRIIYLSLFYWFSRLVLVNIEVEQQKGVNTSDSWRDLLHHRSDSPPMMKRRDTASSSSPSSSSLKVKKRAGISEDQRVRTRSASSSRETSLRNRGNFSDCVFHFSDHQDDKMFSSIDWQQTRATGK